MSLNIGLFSVHCMKWLCGGRPHWGFCVCEQDVIWASVTWFDGAKLQWGNICRTLALLPTCMQSNYFSTMLGPPHITMFNSREYEEHIEVEQKERDILQSKHKETKSRTNFCSSPADKRTLVDRLHQTGTTMWQHQLFQDPHILQEKQKKTL